MSAQEAMPIRGYAVDWMVPRSNVAPKISKFSRAEIGVALHDSIHKRIEGFIASGKGINPFDPEQLDIYAEFRHKATSEKAQKKVNAFYYQDFDRMLRDDNMEKWYWKAHPTTSPMRIRFAVDKPGAWEFTVKVIVNGKTVAEMGPYGFTCLDSRSNGFMKVAAGGQYFELGGQSFMPVGQNLPKPSCHVERDPSGKVLKDPLGCAKCPCGGIEEWCGRINGLPMIPKPYLAYLTEMDKLKAAGANYFRSLIFPNSYEIEFEKLGDYSARMHCAWEMDEMVSHAAGEGLYIQLNLFLPYGLGHAPYGVRAWDWVKEPNEANDIPYCYAKELGLKEPVEFLTNEQARKHFKNRLRYMIARWGYATSIAVLELMSEINGVFPEHPAEVYAWQHEMARYIKEDLGHKDQLLTVSYNGSKPNEAGGDLSYSIPYLDLITHNTHRLDLDRESLIKLYAQAKKYGKPLLFSEIGTGDTEVDKCDNQVEWYKDLWLTLFSGSASAGINWNGFHDVELWRHLEQTRIFTEKINWTDYSLQRFGKSKNKQVAALALVDVKHHNAVGAVHNLTWNYYSNGKDSCGVKYPPVKELRVRKDQVFHPRKGVSVMLEPGKKTYVIEWINPQDGKIISESEVSTDKKGKLFLPHPTLVKDLDLIVFRIHPAGEAFTEKQVMQVIRRSNEGGNSDH